VRELHLSEKKVLSILEKDCRMASSQIAKKTHLSPEGVIRIIERLEENKVIASYSTKIDYYRMGQRIYAVHAKLNNRSKKAISEVKKILKKNSECAWFMFCEGEYDLLISIKVTGANIVMENIMNELSPYIAEKDVSIVTSAFEISKSFLEMTSESPVFTTYNSGEEPIDLSNAEKELINLLKSNGRLGILSIAKKTGTTPKTAMNRIKALREKKAITGFKIKVNTASLGYQPCSALIMIGKTKEEEYRKFVSYCRQSKNIHYFLRQIGKYDIQLEFNVKNVNEFYALIDDIRERFPFIRKITTLITKLET
jgi:Lrp/AsnC family transcriptional regulator, leucine-responsive regulatory protein